MSRTKEFATVLATYVYRRRMSVVQILAIFTDRNTQPLQAHWLQAQIKVVPDHPEVFRPLVEDDFHRGKL